MQITVANVFKYHVFAAVRCFWRIFGGITSLNCKHVFEKTNVFGFFSVCIYECVFALELWNLPVTEAEHTTARFLIGRTNPPPPDSRLRGTSLVLSFFFSLRLKDTHWCFCVLYPFPHIISSSPPSLPEIPTHPSPPCFPFWYPNNGGRLIFGTPKWEASHVPIAFATTSVASVVKGREELSTSCLSVSS